jgi:hypothetical protein
MMTDLGRREPVFLKAAVEGEKSAGPANELAPRGWSRIRTLCGYRDMLQEFIDFGLHLLIGH